MSTQAKEFFLELAEHREIFALATVLFMIFSIIIVFSVVANRLKALSYKKKRKAELESMSIKNVNYDNLRDSKKREILRKIASPDNIDPAPNGYMIIDDGGKEMFTRTFTIVSLPKNVTFVSTFESVFDFPGCTSSVQIKPLSESRVSKKMDRQITILSSEYTAANGDPNRSRRLRNQFNEVDAWAEQVESGEQRFFDVGFIFTLSAPSLGELNKLSDNFRSKALEKSIVVSSCYAVQAEAFSKNAPFNNEIVVASKIIPTNPIKFFMMDKKSISVIFNYTSSTFSHRDGIFLGRDMNTGSPFFYDLFDPTHDGYTLIIAGKTGSGKSATIKEYVARSILYDYRYVCIDSQVRKGSNEGEFAALAQMVNGVNFKISNDSGCILNPFEIGETTKTIRTSSNTVREVRTLELNDKISMVVHTLMTMLQGSKEFSTMENLIPVQRILTDIVSALYQEFGIYDGKPDSLYESGYVTVNGEVTTGRVKKVLPTMSDFYKKVLVAAKNNQEPSLDAPYNLVKMGLKDFVKELYYTKDTLQFLTREDYAYLKYRDAEGRFRVYVNSKGENEDVITIKGIRAYYDGQSTVETSVDCPFTNIDISLLPENEKILARQIAIDFVNEMFIKKNSEDISAAKKLATIFDECHENFSFEYARKTLDNVVRTARKRHVGTILSSQTLKEYDNYVETQAIFKQATTKFVFKQDYQDKDYIKKTLGITDAQVEYIVSVLGGDEKVQNEEEIKKHRGEMCVVDNKRVLFCKVDYLEKTEALVVATDSATIEKVLKKKVVA